MKRLSIVTQLIKISEHSGYLSFGGGGYPVRHPHPISGETLVCRVCYESGIGHNLPFPTLKQAGHGQLTQAQWIGFPLHKLSQEQMILKYIPRGSGLARSFLLPRPQSPLASYLFSSPASLGSQ